MQKVAQKGDVEMEKMKMETANIAAQNVEKIEALFPNCVTEALDEEKSTDEKKVYKIM